MIRDGIPSLPMAAAPVSAPHRLAWLVAACGLGAHSSSCLEWAKRRVDQTLEEAPTASRHAAALPLRPSAHVPAAVVGPDLPHSLAHDREPSVDSPCGDAPAAPAGCMRAGGGARSRAGCLLWHLLRGIDYQPAKRLGYACATRWPAPHECVKSAGVDDRQDFGIVYRSTANRPPQGTPIGMARRMPDGPAHGLPPACGTPASRCPRACLARHAPLLLCGTRPGRRSRG